MKRLTIMLFALLPFVSCGTDKLEPIAFEKLPSKAQSLINTHFADKTITMVFCEEDLFDKDYEARFEDGSKIEFNKDGDWKSIKMKQTSQVPSTVMPEGINAFVATKHPYTFVVSIEKDRRNYEIELNNGVELIFNNKGEFKHYED